MFSVILKSRVETPKKEVAYYTAHNVYVNVKHVVCNTTDDAQVFLSLYDAKDERFIRYVWKPLLHQLVVVGG